MWEGEIKEEKRGERWGRKEDERRKRTEEKNGGGCGRKSRENERK